MKRTDVSKRTSSAESKPSAESAPKGSGATLSFGGVALVGPDEDPSKISDEELDRRFAEAKKEVWKQLHESGALPLIPSRK